MSGYVSKTLKNPQRELFAQGVATGLTQTAAYIGAGYSEIGAAAGASRLADDPVVARRIEQLKSEVERNRERGRKQWNLVDRTSVEIQISNRNYRIAILDDTLTRLLHVMDERGEDPQMEHVPGGKTGLVCILQRGGGEMMREEYAVDTGMIKSILDIQKQTAIELGQWSEKREISGPAGGPIELSEVRALSYENIALARRKLLEARAILTQSGADEEEVSATETASDLPDAGQAETE